MSTTMNINLKVLTDLEENKVHIQTHSDGELYSTIVLCEASLEKHIEDLKEAHSTLKRRRLKVVE